MNPVSAHIPKLISVDKIWDHAQHNALTDLIRFRDEWYCTFREADRHVHGNEGQIRIIKSQDGIHWTSSALLSENGIDLRDPKLSITPTGQLMLLMGGTQCVDKKIYLTRQPRVSFSSDGSLWSHLEKILEPHEWLWRVTWHQGKAYGVSYRFSNPKNKYDEWHVKLFESDDGIHYRMITQWDVEGYPNEATLQFLNNGKMLALLRRDAPHDNHAWMGVSDPPYRDWSWKQMHTYFGGPNFIILPNEQIWAAGRILLRCPYAHFEKTVLARLSVDDIKPVLMFPSDGDCSYPGMVFHEGMLWISYYSTHEEKHTSIYLAKVQI